MSSRNHRDSICESRCARSVSCCAEHLHASMRYVHRVAPQKQAAIIDVGGGDSALVADLLGKGYLEVTVTAPALRRPIAQGRTSPDNVGWCAGVHLPPLPAAGPLARPSPADFAREFVRSVVRRQRRESRHHWPRAALTMSPRATKNRTVENVIWTYRDGSRDETCRPISMPHAVAAVNDAVRVSGSEAP